MIPGFPGFLENVGQNYPDYLRDESRLVGHAESISFPVSEADVRATLLAACRQKMPVTLQGARTGITGGAVPQGGHILNLSRMNKVLGSRIDRDRRVAFVTVQPGLTLADLRMALSEGMPGDASSVSQKDRASRAWCDTDRFFLPPDPTETSASVGGMVSCNASGALTFRYGSVRRYVERLRLVLAEGTIVDLRRGQQFARGRKFALVTEEGRTVADVLPSYVMPAVKNAAGYFVQDDMDLVDLFIGSEGTLGVLTEVELRLVPAPPVIWGLVVFVPEEEAAIAMVNDVRQMMKHVVALEFFDTGSLALAKRQQAADRGLARRIPVLPDGPCSAVHLEWHGETTAEVEEEVMTLAGRFRQYGVSESSTWLVDTPHELSKLKDFRYAIPEAVNLWIDERRRSEPALTKLGTDLAVPDAALDRIMAMYRKGLAARRFEAVIFGHIGDNHLHVNILARNMDEYQEGRELYLEWARSVVAAGGTVSAEHGVGKLKRQLLEVLYGVGGIREMREIKGRFDPAWILNRGNLFDPPMS